MAKTIWSWCIQRNIWITASYLPGCENHIADKKSREFNDQLEWMVDTTIFKQICKTFGKPSLDLFASRLNAQVERYVSWKPDPSAEAVDAFTIDWHNEYFYAFPPFSLITKCLNKIETDRAEGIMIIPNWPTQPWFSRMLDLLVAEPLIFPNRRDVLVQPTTGEYHPLHNHLCLLACRLSGNQSRVQDYQRRLRGSYCQLGDNLPKDSTTFTLGNGWSFANKGELIRCIPLQ